MNKINFCNSLVPFCTPAETYIAYWTHFIRRIHWICFTSAPLLLSLPECSIHWDILKLADQNIISQTHSLNILRIIQEAIYNAMHRAHSKKIIIAVDCLEDGNTVVFVVKKTNGRPFSERQETGQGIQNMKRRAKLIGAEFELTGLKDGAVMRLTYKRDILPHLV